MHIHKNKVKRGDKWDGKSKPTKNGKVQINFGAEVLIQRGYRFHIKDIKYNEESNTWTVIEEVILDND